MQVGDSKNNLPMQKNWSDFLQRTALSLACLLLGSAAVCWVAANWQQASVLQKLGGAQIVLCVFVIFAALACYRTGKGSEHNFSLAGSLAAIATGGLLALVGQIYQTGADAWQLFLLWAILMLPWLVVMRTAFLALLLALLLNLSLILYLGSDHLTGLGWLGFFDLNGSVFALAALNILLLAAWEIFQRHLADHWRIGPRLLATAVIGWWTVAILNSGASGDQMLIVAMPGLALMAAFYLVYTRWRFDMGLVSLALLGAFVFVAVPLMQFVGSEAGLFLVILVLTALAGLGLRHLVFLYRTAVGHPDEDVTVGEPWFVAMFRMVVVTAITALIIALLALMFDITEYHVWMVGLGMELLGAAAYRLSTRPMWRDVAIILTLTGLIIFSLDIFITKPPLFLAVIGMVLAGGLAYLTVSNIVLRFLAALISLSAVMLITWPGGPERFVWNLFDSSARMDLFHAYLRVWLAATLALLALLAANGPSRERLWAPLGWSLVILAQTWAWWAPAPTLLDSAFAFSWTWVLWFAIAVLPVLALGVLLGGCRSLPMIVRVGAPCVLALASVGWVGASGISLSLLWLTLGHAQRQRGLMVFGVIALLGYLGRFYYQLDVPLLGKALLLGLTGGWLLLAWLVSNRVKRKSQPASRAQPLRASGWQPAGLIVGLFIILIVANGSIYRYESIIKHGDRVVLALAPVDPRSIMQGDYMALDYMIAEQLRLRMLNSRNDPAVQAIKRQGHGYLLLRPGTDGVHELDQILAEQPAGARAGNQDAVLLEFRIRNGRVQIVSDAWFFAEGQASHYAQARYGVFRVNERGTGLLVGLLDEQHAPL